VYQPNLRSQVVLESYLVVTELGEGEKRLVHLAQIPSLSAKVYEEADYTFHVVFTSDDFGSHGEALAFIDKITKGLQHG
jgi:hypothetical protein